MDSGDGFTMGQSDQSRLHGASPCFSCDSGGSFVGRGPGACTTECLVRTCDAPARLGQLFFRRQLWRSHALSHQCFRVWFPSVEPLLVRACGPEQSRRGVSGACCGHELPAPTVRQSIAARCRKCKDFDDHCLGE